MHRAQPEAGWPIQRKAELPYKQWMELFPPLDLTPPPPGTQSGDSGTLECVGQYLYYCKNLFNHHLTPIPSPPQLFPASNPEGSITPLEDRKTLCFQGKCSLQGLAFMKGFPSLSTHPDLPNFIFAIGRSCFLPN